MNSSEVQLSNSSWVNVPTVLSSYSGVDIYRFGRFQEHWKEVHMSPGNSQLGFASYTIGDGSYNTTYPFTATNSISDSTNGIPRTGSSTEQSSVICKMFMRIN